MEILFYNDYNDNDLGCFSWRIFARTGTKASTSIEEDPGKEWHDLEMGARRSLDRFARVKLILDARSRVHLFQPGRDNHVRNNNGYHDAYRAVERCESRAYIFSADCDRLLACLKF